MKYRVKAGKLLGDKAVMSDLSKGIDAATSRKLPFVSRFLSGVIGYFISTSAFIPKSLLRIRLGERTYGILTFISVYLVIWFLHLYPQVYEAVSLDVSFSSMNKDALGVKTLIFITALFYLPIMIITKIGGWSNIHSSKVELNAELPPELNWLLLAILVIGLCHFLELYLRRRKKGVLYSYHSGDSMFFKWLIGQRVLGYTITHTTVWMVVEPLVILIIAWIMRDLFGLDSLFIILTVSAICLFLEEYKIHIEKRHIILDLIDGQLDADLINKIQKEYQDGIEEAKKESPKEFTTSFGQSGNNVKESSGSDSSFRVKIR